MVWVSFVLLGRRRQSPFQSRRVRFWVLDGDLSEEKVFVKDRLLARATDCLFDFKLDRNWPFKEDGGCVIMLIFEAVEAGGPSHNGGFCEGV